MTKECIADMVAATLTSMPVAEELRGEMQNRWWVWQWWATKEDNYEHYVKQDRHWWVVTAREYHGA